MSIWTAKLVVMDAINSVSVAVGVSNTHSNRLALRWSCKDWLRIIMHLIVNRNRITEYPLVRNDAVAGRIIDCDNAIDAARAAALTTARRNVQS